VIDFGVERWIYPLYGWMGRPSRQKAAGVYSQMGRSYWLKSRRRNSPCTRKSRSNLGSDIDNWLVDYFATTQGLVATLTTRLAERLKIQLSSQEQASEVYFNDETFESYELQLDRYALETILKEHQFWAMSL